MGATPSDGAGSTVNLNDAQYDTRSKADETSRHVTSTASDDYSKRATLIFLAAVGGTLLVTGATGSLMLRRASAAGSKSNATSSSASTATASASAAARSSSSQLPLKYAQPGSGLSSDADHAARKHRKSNSLRDLFNLSASTGIDTISTTRFDFRTNRHLASSLEPATRPLSADATASHDDEDVPVAGFAVMDGVKALAIATTIVAGTAGATVWILAKRMGATDPQSFADGLRHQYFAPFARTMSLYMPFAVPSKLKQPELSIEEKAQMAVDTREWDRWALETDVQQFMKDGPDTQARARGSSEPPSPSNA